MDFELLPLLVGVALGGLLSKGGKGVLKPLVKGYMNLADKTREMTATVREDLRDAVEEARYEYRQEVSAHDGEGGHAVAAPAAAQQEAPAKPSRSSSRRRSGTSSESATTSRSRSTSARRSGGSRTTRAQSAKSDSDTKSEGEQAQAA